VDGRGPRAKVESVDAEQGERDPLEAEPQAGGVGSTAVGELDPVGEAKWSW